MAKAARHRFVRALALSLVLGGTSYAALNLISGLRSALALVNTTISRLTVDGRTQATVVARARLNSPVVARPGGWTAVALTGSTWVQPAGALNLIAGSISFEVPDRCTGSSGNALTLAVDGHPVTFAAAPTEPSSKTLSMPFTVGTLTDPGRAKTHTLSARFGSSCTGKREDYILTDVKVDVLEFR